MEKTKSSLSKNYVNIFDVFLQRTNEKLVLTKNIDFFTDELVKMEAIKDSPVAILDVGCGAGNLSAPIYDSLVKLSANGNIPYFGMDVIDKHVEQTHNTFKNKHISNFMVKNVDSSKSGVDLAREFNIDDKYNVIPFVAHVAYYPLENGEECLRDFINNVMKPVKPKGFAMFIHKAENKNLDILRKHAPRPGVRTNDVLKGMLKSEGYRTATIPVTSFVSYPELNDEEWKNFSNLTYSSDNLQEARALTEFWTQKKITDYEPTTASALIEDMREIAENENYRISLKQDLVVAFSKEHNSSFFVDVKDALATSCFRTERFLNNLRKGQTNSLNRGREII